MCTYVDSWAHMYIRWYADNTKKTKFYQQTHTHIYIYIHTRQLSEFQHAGMWHARVCVCVFAFMYVHMYVYLCMYACMNACMHVCV